MIPKTTPTAALVIIGAEVLSGKVDDLNGPFLLRELRARGVYVQEIRTITDSVPAIADAIAALHKQNTYVFTSGGIGPTHDDVTVEGVASGLQRAVTRDAEFEKQLRDHYGLRANDARLKLANVPVGGTMRLSPNGGPYIQVDNITILPGVPSFLKECFQAATHALMGTPFFTRAILLNTSESEIAEVLTAAQNRHPSLAMGSYPRFEPGPYRVKITIDGNNSATVDHAMHELVRQLDPTWVIDTE